MKCYPQILYVSLSPHFFPSHSLPPSPCYSLSIHFAKCIRTQRCPVEKIGITVILTRTNCWMVLKAVSRSSRHKALIRVLGTWHESSTVRILVEALTCRTAVQCFIRYEIIDSRRNDEFFHMSDLKSETNRNKIGILISGTRWTR